jgi:hypothetical protein
MSRRFATVLAVLLMLGCQPGASESDAGTDAGADAGASGDPCAPNGHIHRERTGDWCHCNRGYRPVMTGLGCEVDPNYTGNTTVDFTGTAERACWHAVNGPFASVADGEAADAFLTFFTLDLAPQGQGLYSASVRYRAAVTGPHVATLSPRVNLALREVLPSGGEKEVPILATQVTTACAQLSQQFGFELVKGADYRLVFGPSRETRVSFLVDQVR